MLKKLRQWPGKFCELFPETLFLVAAGTLFAIVLGALVPRELVYRLAERRDSPLLVIYAELIGFISPGPRYIIYPILKKLVEYGLPTGAIIALIGGHVLIEPSTAMIEAGFFGWRFPVKRFFVSFVVTFLAGMLTIILETYFGLDIL
jgi:uncharacterized membrane protein YraQ (UPF0718 family)